MNETRFTISEGNNFELGEVVYFFVDKAGYRTSSPYIGDSLTTIKGGTVFGSATYLAAKRFFVGWTSADVDLPMCSVTPDIEEFKKFYTNVRFSPDYRRYTKCIVVCDYEFVIRAPLASRIAATKGVKDDHLVCCKCHEPIQYAAPNMADGSFKCFQCRSK